MPTPRDPVPTPRVPAPYRVLAALATAAVTTLAQPLPTMGKDLKVLDIPLPPRSRATAAGPHISSRGFRQTVTYYQRYLARTGIPHRAIDVYAHRGTAVARFLSTNPRTPWHAIHIYRHTGRTQIMIVPRHPLTPRPTQGKERNSLSSGQTPG